MPVTAVDLFCGAGGLTRGLLDAGIHVAAGIDFDQNCEYAYQHNNQAQFLHERVEDVNRDTILRYYPENDIKVLVGCAPCQPFSSHTNKYKKGLNAPRDERWFLLNHFARLVEEVRPDVISMENVPQLSKQQIFEDFVSKLQALNYHVSWSVVFCPDYGIPQRRNRLVLLASRYGDISLMAPTHTPENYRTVRNAIGNILPIVAGENNEVDRLHCSSRLNALNMRRIQSSRPGGTWRDWNEDLLCACHKKDSGSTYASVYARMEWDQPSPTITTEFYNYGTGRFGHPEQDRALSLREGALLQTFPADYEFLPDGAFSFKQIGKMIGNAVPVRLGEIIGETILDHLRERGVINE